MQQTRTTTHLLEGLRNPREDDIWRAFDARYRPIIIGFARRLGVDDTDAADVAQDTLVRFIKAYANGEYDRSRGRLRSWIISIARYRVVDTLRARARRNGVRGDSVMADLPAEPDLDAIWDEARRRSILRLAVEELRSSGRTHEKTIVAFEQLVLRVRSGAEVAESLGMTLDDVYQAKNRVATRLRAIITKLESLYDEDG
jgi:RNA polymerase sigma-70 factor (ECF subfamily)